MSSAIAQLEGPAYPACLGYLLDWAHELLGRSGVGMNGFAPLTYSTIRDWSVLTDRAIAPHEVHALMVLDRAMRTTPEASR